MDSAEARRLLAELRTPAGQVDPYPAYGRLRELGLILRADDGGLVVTRFADCEAVTRDPRCGRGSVAQLEATGVPPVRRPPGARDPRQRSDRSRPRC